MFRPSEWMPQEAKLTKTTLNNFYRWFAEYVDGPPFVIAFIIVCGIIPMLAMFIEAMIAITLVLIGIPVLLFGLIGLVIILVLTTILISYIQKKGKSLINDK